MTKATKVYHIDQGMTRYSHFMVDSAGEHEVQVFVSPVVCTITSGSVTVSTSKETALGLHWQSKSRARTMQYMTSLDLSELACMTALKKCLDDAPTWRIALGHWHQRLSENMS